MISAGLVLLGVAIGLTFAKLATPTPPQPPQADGELRIIIGPIGDQ